MNIEIEKSEKWDENVQTGRSEVRDFTHIPPEITRLVTATVKMYFLVCWGRKKFYSLLFFWPLSMAYGILVS